MEQLDLLLEEWGPVEAKPHTPVYMMHKFWARRPWNVFRKLIALCSNPGDIVLDPFCGGGTTVVEGLALRRRVVGVDVNPLATYITEMEVRPLDLKAFQEAFHALRDEIEPVAKELYATLCPTCGGEAALEWAEWEEETKTLLRIKGICDTCGHFEKEADKRDAEKSQEIEDEFEQLVRKFSLWYPRTLIPQGDKTKDLIKRGIRYFYELFTRRNLFMLALLRKHILSLPSGDVRDFLLFALSSTLKWASKMSHLRGDIVEGWAMHAYWIYPRSLEINVWRTFCRRIKAIERGKRFSNRIIGNFYKPARNFEGLRRGKATCLLLTQSADNLPLPSESVDAIVTDPPYGGNVNYGELSDFFLVWLRGEVMDKGREIVINKTQEKDLHTYEEMLHLAFRECWRVLKSDGRMVFTFNSKDTRVVASSIIAATKAGFSLETSSVIYQPPIRAYQTTFHGIFVDSLLGDFVLPFRKGNSLVPSSGLSLPAFLASVDRILKRSVEEGHTEKQVREEIYRLFLPFVGEIARDKPEDARIAASYIEKRILEFGDHFSTVRKKIENERRTKFAIGRGERYG